MSGAERWEGRGMMQSSNCIRLLGIWCLSLNHYNTLTHNPISAPLSSGISHDFLIMNENMWSNSVVWACSDSLGQPLMHLSNVETQKCILKCLSCLIPADTNYFVPFCQMTNLLRLLKKKSTGLHASTTLLCIASYENWLIIYCSLVPIFPPFLCKIN